MSNSKEKLRDWWVDFIENIRDEDAAQFHTVQDYSSPCQVEIFWIEEPLEGQLTIITRDQDRPDKEVIVNGPYSGENFIEEVAEVSDESRWQKNIPPQHFKTPPGKTPIRADVLASLISKLDGRLKQSIYSDLSSIGFTFLDKSRLWSHASYRISTQNVAEIDQPKRTESTDRGKLLLDNRTTIIPIMKEVKGSVAGVDGCPYCWFATVIDDYSVEMNQFPDIESLYSGVTYLYLLVYHFCPQWLSFVLHYRKKMLTTGI